MFLSAKAIAQMAGQRKPHFLNASAVRHDKSLGDAVGLRNIGVHLIAVQPGHHSTELHHHLVGEECVYVLSGHGLALIGEAVQTIEPGDFIGYPLNGIAHAMQATGDEPLVCLVMGERVDHEVTDYPRAKKRLYRNHGELNLVDYSNIQRIER